MSAALHIARGDLEPERRVAAPLRSCVAGVSDAAWTRFVRALQTQPPDAVSDSNGLGAFEMRPRRLADLGLMANLCYVRRGGRQVWDGDFVAPLTRDRFLGSWVAQYNALARSVEAWVAEGAERVAGGPAAALSRSGALAVLHRAGPGGLGKWGWRQYERSARIVAACDGIF